MTLHDLAVRARDDLERAGVAAEVAALDVELLARHVLHWDRATWLTRRAEVADTAFSEAFCTLIERRTRREPVAYLRGVQEFCGREFRVTPDVLIPRPETELVVEVASAHLAKHPRSTIVDIGTGSGCIAITLAIEHPDAEVHATDVSTAALAVAHDNAARLGATRIHFTAGPYLATVPLPVDLIVSNPPYIATADAETLAPEVRAYEPAAALFGGSDGLEIVHEILQRSRDALRPEGCLVLEIGYGQATRLTAAIADVAGLRVEEIREDLAGIPRVALIRRV